MNEKLKKLRNKLTDKQVKFTEFTNKGVERAKAYFDAGYKAKTRKVAQQRACKLLTDNEKVMAYLDTLKDQDDKNTNISRTMQLNKLNDAFDVANGQDNPSAMVSAIREQNEMLGYHREQAPNLEKEQARKDIIEHELQELERLCRERTGELSKPALRLHKGA